MITVSAERVGQQITTVFAAWGMSVSDAETASTVMVDTDLHGIDSHGLGMLPGYHQMFKRGKLVVQPSYETVKEMPSLALIDAGQGLGHPVSVHAMTTAIDKAKTTGVAAVTVRNSNHFGAAGYYARMAAERGLVGIAMTSTPGTAMVPTFGRKRQLGTNPIAFAAPAKNNPPFLLDMATTTVAVGKVSIAKRLGKEMPEGWTVDNEGKPLTDPNIARELRLLTPLGGNRELGSHKGYGLGAMVEILCCTLSGAGARCVTDPENRSEGPTDVGHFFLAIDPGMFRDGDGFEDDLDDLIDVLHDTPRSDPAQPVLVAGDPERAAYAERSHSGIPIAEALIEEVRSVAEGTGVPFVLESNR